MVMLDGTKHNDAHSGRAGRESDSRPLPCTRLNHSTNKVLGIKRYRAVSQFFDAFENNSNFGQKVLTCTDFRSKFVKKLLSHNINFFSVLIGRYRFTFLPHYGALWETATKGMKSY